MIKEEAVEEEEEKVTSPVRDTVNSETLTTANEDKITKPEPADKD